MKKKLKRFKDISGVLAILENPYHVHISVKFFLP